MLAVRAGDPDKAELYARQTLTALPRLTTRSHGQYRFGPVALKNEDVPKREGSFCRHKNQGLFISTVGAPTWHWRRRFSIRGRTTPCWNISASKASLQKNPKLDDWIAEPQGGALPTFLLNTSGFNESSKESSFLHRKVPQLGNALVTWRPHAKPRSHRRRILNPAIATQPYSAITHIIRPVELQRRKCPVPSRLRQLHRSRNGDRHAWSDPLVPLTPPVRLNSDSVKVTTFCSTPSSPQRALKSPDGSVQFIGSGSWL